jgi:hypothetical protein
VICEHYGNNYGVSSKKLKIEGPHDPAIPLLGTYSKESRSAYSRDTCTPMFIAALFKIAKLCK